MNATPTSDDAVVAALRQAAHDGVPTMRRDPVRALVAGRRATRRAHVARATAGMAGLAVVATGGAALADGGILSLSQAPADSAAAASPSHLSIRDLPGPVDGTFNGTFNGTWQEYAAAFAACLESQGWNVEEGDSDEGLSLEITNSGPGADETLTASQEGCRKSLGTKVEPERDDAAVRALYDGVVAQYTCLADAGFIAAVPPSFSVYLGMYRAGAIYADPMEHVTVEDYFTALEACPRSAPAE